MPFPISETCIDGYSDANTFVTKLEQDIFGLSMDNEKYNMVDRQERVVQAHELESYIFSHAQDILDESDEILQPRF